MPSSSPWPVIQKDRRKNPVTEPMILRVRLAAPIQAVRHALTDAASLRVWLAEHAEVDLPRAYAFWGRYTPEGEAPHQRLLHVDDHTLRFNWRRSVAPAASGGRPADPLHAPF